MNQSWCRWLIVVGIGFLFCQAAANAQFPNRESFEVAGHRAFLLPPPAAKKIDGRMPWVWYAPTFDKRLPNKEEQWMIDRLHAEGIAIAGVDVGESYGSPKGVAVYESFYKELTQVRGFQPKPVLLARSRGGLMLYSWAIEHPDSVAGIAGIYPVCNIASYPGIAKAAPAYGMSPTELKANLTKFNPVDRLENLAKAKVPVFHIQGDSDRVVPHEENTGLLADRYQALGGPIKFELIKGQGHNMWRGWFESQSLTDFMINRARGWPDFELGSPFVKDAILQRNVPLPIWGWGRPTSKINVSFAGEQQTAVVDANGKWSVELDPQPASAIERKLTVTHGDQSIVLDGILVGEVWFASGQSNMDWLAGKSNCRDLASEVARSKTDIPIREYTVDSGSSLFPQSRTTSKEGWKRSRYAASFSALSLAFANELYNELKVPIGILRSSHGATPIETWIAYEGLQTHPDPAIQEIAKRVRMSNPSTAEGKKALEEYSQQLQKWQQESSTRMNLGGTALPRPSLPGIYDDWKGATRMFNKKISPLIPFAIRGAIWCQGESNSNDGKVYAAKMEALVNGWRKCWGRPDLPFYFTQLQCYGEPNPDNVGFADLREAQTLFLRNNQNVGMVAQHDLNPARPGGIHPFNKLDPGKRLARWALAKDYGKDIPYMGPIYDSHSIQGDTIRVRFQQTGPGGELMVGSKGMEANAGRTDDAFVEPARETPGEKLKHFRVAGADKIWHPAAAVIEGNEVVVRSDAVPKPVGVQYAYFNSPIGANLYNQAGLPVIPFAVFNDRQMFNEDDPEIVAAAKADAQRRWGKKTYLLPSTLFRDHCVLQRDQAVPVWGHGIPGSTITVTFGGQTVETTVNEFERWKVNLKPMAASTVGRDLSIRSNREEARIIRDVLVGDVWFLTGSRQLDGQLVLKEKDGTYSLEELPLVREFRIKTKARRFRTPRKYRMEIGGGKYVASWQPADFDDQGDPPSIAAYHFAKQLQQPNVPLGIVTLGAENPPITWVSHEAMQSAAGFEKERDDLNLAYPNTKVCQQAVGDYLATMRKYNQTVESLISKGIDIPPSISDSAPAFPQPYYNQWVSRTQTPTHTYNFCISPLVPFAMKGYVWLPGKDNISDDVSRYAPSLKVLANNLAPTFGQNEVHFLYAQPSEELVSGITDPGLGSGGSYTLTEWPRDWSVVAAELGALAAKQSKLSPAKKVERPNVILMMADDLGFGDVSCYEKDGIRTPNLDQLATDGLRLTDFYCGATVCTPSRIALLTGAYPPRLGWKGGVVGYRIKGENGLSPAAFTMAEVFQQAGYVTGISGKWHLGDSAELLPGKQGFDSTFYIRRSNNQVKKLWRGTSVVADPFDNRRLTEQFTNEAIRFIQSNQQRPFFLYLPFSAPHFPADPHPDWKGKSSQGPYGDVVEELDDRVGRILAALKQTGLAKNTIVVFTSDNGPEPSQRKWASKTPLRGRKWSSLEGGTRVPFLIRWPGKIPAGKVMSKLTAAIDLLPTLAAACNINFNDDDLGYSIDGKNVWNSMTDPDSTDHARRTLLYWNGWAKLEAIRVGDWKLYLDEVKEIAGSKTGPVLINLATDPAERVNVAEKFEERVAMMKREAEVIAADIRKKSIPLAGEPAND